MFTAGAESLLRQAREVQDEELQRFCSRISVLLQEENLGPDAIDSLRRLFLIVSATKYNRRLEKTCVDLLQSTLCLPVCPEPLQVLCAAILKEMSPSDSLSLSCDRTQNTWQLSLVASVLLAQGNRRDEVRTVAQHILRALESRQPEGPSLRHLLPIVSKVVGLSPGILQEDDKSELEGSTLSVISATSATSRLLPPRERLREVAFEYCQRLIEQSTRRALRKGDSDLQKACLVEAVLVLDVLCRQDPSFLYRTISCLKALHGRLSGDLASVRVLLPLAHFFLTHGEAAAVDSEAIYQHLFTRVPAERFHSPLLAFEFIQFCRDNLHLFGGNLSVLKLTFPNLFKFLAWNSPPLTSEFVELLPALVDSGTAVEMLHSLLDLPCLTAALDLQLRQGPNQTLGGLCQKPMSHLASDICTNRSWPSASERPLWDTSLRIPSCLEAFRDPQFQGLFQHLLRPKASGTIERLAPLYQLLQPMASCARVAQCAEAVPTLLHMFFSAVTQVTNGSLTNQLALLLLERSDSLYQVPQYEACVHRVLSSQFLVLCKLKPSLVVELARDLLEFLGSVSSIHSRASMVTSVVWAVGEYLSVTCDRRCTVEQINKFFEALEALLFEVTQSRPSTTLPRCPPQVVTVLMTTLTKLASRSQDLIPRVSLLLSKMRTLAQSPASNCSQVEEGAEAIRTRATELLNLLKMPSVAQFVLTPSMEVCSPRYHRDINTALPLALGMVTRLMEKEAGLLPG
ncbi:AP-5 complex subunit zeta-1 isoform X4 [Nycticebus coucang]|uniref:AP-5 complex subunit zeta-1 isoform X4 n=1 Tax=Nycticebus coucang TaxID=9470 RepID=UPI00234CC358|nr:AP-5 complex subunit zeta-1 isoform X4 [Nycticebus coucang]